MAGSMHIQSTPSASQAGGKRVLAFVIALAMAVLLFLGGGLFASSQAYAQIYTVDDTQQAQVAADTEAAEDGTEAIVDDEVPMSSGLGASEVVASTPVSFQWAIVAGFVAVVAFFAASTLRTNKSISKMRDLMP